MPMTVTPAPRVAAAIVAIVCAPAGMGLLAQAPAAATREFEVASVKPALSPYELGRQAATTGGPLPAMSFGIRTLPGGRLSATATLRALIARAYGFKEYQIEGGPSWLGEDYFTIEARAEGEAAAADIDEMLKALLAQRFGLRAHTATRRGQAHTLVLARTDGRLGSGLKPTPAECLAEMEARKRAAAAAPPGAPAPSRSPAAARPPDMTPRCGLTMMAGSSSGAMTLSASGQPLSMLVDRLASDLGATVVDRTGLTGLFDFMIEFESRQTAARLGGPGGLDVNSTEAPRLPLRNAIEGQLGLKLESAEAEVPILVIDAVDRPTPD
jgi:uncharacterized protein (TIGR03435 family)